MNQIAGGSSAGDRWVKWNVDMTVDEADKLKGMGCVMKGKQKDIGDQTVRKGMMRQLSCHV